ncbi:MAG: branched-chain amino acid ABC transporter permease [Promethearchaeota archaeon]
MIENTLVYIFGAFIVNTLAIGLVYSLATTSLTTMYGGLGIPNVALGQFFIMGAYLLYFFHMQMEIDLVISMLMTMAVMLAFYFIIERTIIRKYYDAPRSIRVVYYLLLTIGLSQIIGNIILLAWEGNTYRVVTPLMYDQVYILSFPATGSQIVGIVLLSVALILLFLFLRYTRHGRAIRSLLWDREMTSLMGVDIARLSMFTFLLASGVASFIGMIYGLMYSFDPTVIGMVFSLTFMMMLVGGRGSVMGSMALGFLFGASQAFLTMFLFPSASLYFFFIVMLLILLIKPEGLFRR